MKPTLAVAIIVAVALALVAYFESGRAHAQAACVRTQLPPGPVSGEWTSDCLSPNRPVSPSGPGDGNYYARYYDFHVSAESEVTITLESSQDTYLYLLTGAGRNGEIIAENDDIDTDGENYNSRIVAMLHAGDYSIEATTYEPNTTGAFTLILDVKGDSDYAALVALYNATNGDGWTDNANWLTDAPLGEWYGVTTNAEGRVTHLALAWNKLDGQMPAELGNLTAVEVLNLDFNDLTGTIPPELGNLFHLREMSINTNPLTGGIPSELGNLVNLEELLLSGSNLSGAIPPELGSLSNLEDLSVSVNNLTGMIPIELSQLTKLESLSLGGNQLTGTIPPQLGSLLNLTELDINGNQLTGELPQSLTKLQELQAFYFHDNAGLCAPSNYEFQAWLQSIGVVEGDICAAPPPVVDKCVEPIGADNTANGAWTSDCLSTKRPLAADKPKPGEYYARYYTFSLSAPSDVTITLNSSSDPYLYLLSGSGKNGAVLSGHDDIDPITGNYNSRIEQTLQVGNYTIEATTFAPAVTGSFTLTLNVRGTGHPSPAYIDRAALIALYNATDGDNWTNNANWLTAAPLSEWHGVTTDGDGRVTSLSLGWNNLTGGLPSDLGRLSELRGLLLSDNALFGAIPSELGNLSRLKYLGIGHNRLDGAIPPELGKLTSLKELYLGGGDNRLTGTIPPELGNLVKLERLIIGHTQLSGEIPPELGSLVNLERLILDSNRLTGALPSELGNLVNLEHLALHTNQLSGELPKSLTRLTELEWFNFGNNIGLCAPGDAEFQAWLQSIEYTEGANCADLNGWSHRPVFDGGIDLGVTYIERLPRYERYKIAYLHSGECPYPYDEFKGAVLCPGQDGLKRWPNAGETVELRAHVWNFGDTTSGPFDYTWRVDGTIVLSGRHDGLASGAHAAIPFSTQWPGIGSNPLITFKIDPDYDIEELLKYNNVLIDWIKGYTIGLHFTPEAYMSLRLSNEPGESIQSPEYWVQAHIMYLNQLLADAGLEERIRTELFLISEDRELWASHPLRYQMDGWWSIRDDGGFYTTGGYRNRPQIDWGLLHELLHQLGVIDIYQMHLGAQRSLLPDANRPGYKAGCGSDYWRDEETCFRFYEPIDDIMGGSWIGIGPHTAGGLRSNAGHRRGFYGEYLYDTPAYTSVRIVDEGGNPLPNVSLRFYQYELQDAGHILDVIPEFTLTTDAAGVAALPNRGITGIVTTTGHQLKPNPFGHIDVVGRNGLFVIEMKGAACTNYEWLTIVDLNLAYWNGQTGSVSFDRTLRCPPPSGSGAPSGTPSDTDISDYLPPSHSPYSRFAPQTGSR